MSEENYNEKSLAAQKGLSECPTDYCTTSGHLTVISGAWDKSIKVYFNFWYFFRAFVWFVSFVTIPETMAVSPIDLPLVFSLAAGSLCWVFFYCLKVDFLDPASWIRHAFGYGSISLVSASETIFFEYSTESGTPLDTGLERISIRDLVARITVPVRLNPFIFNGHLQTIATALGWAGTDVHINYKRKVWTSDSKVYPGQFSFDFVVPPPAEPLPRDRNLPVRTHNFTDKEWLEFIATDVDKPLVVILHGFLGGSHEKYIRHALELFDTEQARESFSVVVMNQRGCAYTKLTSQYMYTPGATWDLRQFVKWCRHQWPKRRIFAVGFSIGANLLCNYLGEEGDSCELEAAILVGCPWNLDLTNGIMEKSLMGLHVYQRALGDSFRKHFERNLEHIAKDPKINVDKARKSRYLWQWDRYVQCPTWGYPSEGSYYRDTSCIDAVAAIRTPVLALHAKDDPVCLDVAVPYYLIEMNPYIIMCTSSIGGHLGWFEWGGDRWSNEVIYAFIAMMSRGVVREKSTKSERSSTTEATKSDQPTWSATGRKLIQPLLGTESCLEIG